MDGWGKEKKIHNGITHAGLGIGHAATAWMAIKERQ
jgi:hypothetical protein